MTNIVILDDNKAIRKLCEEVIEKLNAYYTEGEKFHVVISTENSLFVKNYLIQNHEPTIFLIAVVIYGHMEGIALAKAIHDANCDYKIVFMTAFPQHIQFCTEAKLIASNIILKSKKYFKTELFQTLKILHKQCAAQSFYCHNILGHHHILYGTIYFFEKVKNRSKIILEYEYGSIPFTDSLKNVIKGLDNRFIRCHSGYIVNKNKIVHMESGNKKIILDNGKYCYYSHFHKKELEQWMRLQQ